MYNFEQLELQSCINFALHFFYCSEVSNEWPWFILWIIIANNHLQKLSALLHLTKGMWVHSKLLSPPWVFLDLSVLNFFFTCKQTTCESCSLCEAKMSIFEQHWYAADCYWWNVFVKTI